MLLHGWEGAGKHEMDCSGSGAGSVQLRAWKDEGEGRGEGCFRREAEPNTSQREVFQQSELHKL